MPAPRFAILEHDHPVLHWDLLLEDGPACRTWRLSSPPHEGATLAAEALPDHRLMYLDYEGPVGGDRGTVTRWDSGRFVWLTSTEAAVSVLINGERCIGRLDLTRHAESWQASFLRQEKGSASV